MVMMNQRTVREIVLQRLEFGARQHLPRHIFESTRFDAYLDPLCQDMVLSLRSFVAGKDNGHHVEIRCVPRTWVDHWKLAHWNSGWMNALRWLGCISEPQLTKFVFTTQGKTLFPDIPATFMGEHSHFSILHGKLEEFSC